MKNIPRSQFPGKVDNWANKQDVPVTMQPIVAQYQEAWDNMDIATIETLRIEIPTNYDISVYCR